MAHIHFIPTEKYVALTDERLSLISDALRDVRDQALKLYDPLGGDDPWSHGCRVYSRSRFRIIQLSKEHHPWLTIVKEDAELKFTFAIEGIPVRFYRGSPDDPPSNYLAVTYGELEQWQLPLFKDGRKLDKILRIAIETDTEGRVASAKLVELDKAKQVTGVYLIPFGVGSRNLLPMESKPYHTEAVRLEPKTEEITELKKQANSK